MLRLYKPRRRIIAEAVAALNAYGVSKTTQEQLVTLLDEQDGHELYRANPRLLADHLQLPDREMLKILLMGLKEGIVTLHWEVECPVCKGLDFQPKHLHDLKTLHTCPACHQIHSTDIDDGVRVTFTVDERLRKLDPDADDPHFRERTDHQYGVVSGHQILTLSAFRDLFPRETLPPGESLRVRRVAILFTDLAGSTTLYARRGDTKAYELVRHHFDVLFGVVERFDGIVVKTIGDAVMAAFTEPINALSAAIAMHQELERLNQQLALPIEDQLILKVGIDMGPCISVTLNDRPDYFGTVVNTAAKIQATSQGNSIAVTNPIVIEAAAANMLKNCIVQRRSLRLKGLESPITVHHIVPNLSSSAGQLFTS